MNREISERVARIRERVERAAGRCGRKAAEICIVAVSKTQPPSAIEAALAAGICDIGENYVQEARAKAQAVSRPAVWHLVGTLQRNKVRPALELFQWIHTLDRVPLALALERRAAERGGTVDVLIEVNLGGEPSKSGVAAGDVPALLEATASCPHVRVRGLMTIPPPAADPEEVRPFFRRLRELRDHWQAQRIAGAPLEHLSMGMSDDFEIAIEEGATMIRLGRAIFGERAAQPWRPATEFTEP